VHSLVTDAFFAPLRSVREAAATFRADTPCTMDHFVGTHYFTFEPKELAQYCQRCTMLLAMGEVDNRGKPESGQGKI
jgi:hypothetical protein